jgi:hypothetical protein
MQYLKDRTRLINNSRKISTSLFALIIVCFFLPFVTVSCSGGSQQAFPYKVEFSGMEMATGKNIDISSSPAYGYANTLSRAFSGFSSSANNQPTTQHTPSFTPAVFALAAAMSGVIVGWMNLQKRYVVHTAIGVSGFLLMLFLRASVLEEVDKNSRMMGASVFGASFFTDFSLGFWLVLFLFLAVASFNGWVLYRQTPMAVSDYVISNEIKTKPDMPDTREEKPKEGDS